MKKYQYRVNNEDDSHSWVDYDPNTFTPETDTNETDVPLTQKEIKDYIKERNILLEKYDSDQCENVADEILSLSEIDRTEALLVSEIWNNFKIYEVDFMIECFTHFGASPSVLYDDQGHFAVVSDGYGPSGSKITGEMTFFVKEKMWKKTIRKALYRWIKKTYQEYYLKGE